MIRFQFIVIIGFLHCVQTFYLDRGFPKIHYYFYKITKPFNVHFLVFLKDNIAALVKVITGQGDQCNNIFIYQCLLLFENSGYFTVFIAFI